MLNKHALLACLNATCPFPDTLLQIRNTVMFVLSTTCRLCFPICSLGTLSRSETISQETFPNVAVFDNFCNELPSMNFAETHMYFQDLTLRPGKNKRLTNRLWKFKAKKEVKSFILCLFIYSLAWFFKMLRQWPYFLYLPNLFLFILFYSDKSSMKHLQPMHISQNYFCQASSVTCPWDMTCSKLRRSINPHFQDNANYDHSSSCIKCFMLISLILKNQEGLLFCWRALLSDWMIGKHLPSPSHNPSCGHHCPFCQATALARYNFCTSHD